MFADVLIDDLLQVRELILDLVRAVGFFEKDIEAILLFVRADAT